MVIGFTLYFKKNYQMSNFSRGFIFDKNYQICKFCFMWIEVEFDW